MQLMNSQSMELLVGDVVNMPSNGKAVNMDDDMPAFAAAEGVTTDTARRLALLYELPEQFEAETRLDELLQTMLEDLVAVIPEATHGALLLRDCEHDELLLKAYVSSNGPVVNKLLVRCAMSGDKGFIWQCNEEDDVNDHISGIYVPLLWQGEALGVICLNNPKRDAIFTGEDLQLLSAVAHCVATVIANRQLQEDMRQKSKLLDRLLKNFSPKIRGKLMERARHGKLRPGGKKSEVTILYADIRGFTKMSVEKDAEDIMDILNAYFSELIKIIFRYDGTIDKFIGDEILAVFGSPEPDAKQHEKAVQTAWEMQAAMTTLNTERKARGEVTCDIGIGIHCGEVLHGFIGSAERIEFTVIGDAVNRASRYCDGAGAGEVLISPEVYQRVWEIVKEERITTKTKHEGSFTAHRVKDVNLQNSCEHACTKFLLS